MARKQFLLIGQRLVSTELLERHTFPSGYYHYLKKIKKFFLEQNKRKGKKKKKKEKEKDKEKGKRKKEKKKKKKKKGKSTRFDHH